MTNTAMREELIFITNIIKSGSAFGQCQSDGAGVFIPPPIFAKYGNGRDIGDCMLARMINNANDVRGELPMLAISLTVPMGVIDQDTGSVTLVGPDTQLATITDILMDDGYDDRWFSVEDMLAELRLDETPMNIKSVKDNLDILCDQGVCAHVTSRIGKLVRHWYTSDMVRP